MDFLRALIYSAWSAFYSNGLPYLRTEVRYYKPLPIHQLEKPYECEFDVGAVAGAKRTNIELEQREIDVHDVRGAQEGFTLEKNGFEFVHHFSALTRQDFSSRSLIESRYLPECQELVRQRYHASQVIVMGFNIRDNDPKVIPKLKGALRPVRTVHVDQSPSALLSRLENSVGKDAAKELIQERRCLIINVWRPLSDPVDDYPLGYCDVQTVRFDDCVAVDLVKRDNYEGESLYLRYNTNHRFYYLSRQRPYEVTLMKMAESNPEDPKRYYQGLPHVAFPLPHDKKTPQPPPRESIEVRTIVII